MQTDPGREAAPGTFRELWQRLTWPQRRRLLLIAAYGLGCFALLCGVACGEILLVLRLAQLA